MPEVAYDRSVLVMVLERHWSTPTSGCSCGGVALGRSFTEHVADAYERAAIARKMVIRAARCGACLEWVAIGAFADHECRTVTQGRNEGAG